MGNLPTASTAARLPAAAIAARGSARLKAIVARAAGVSATAVVSTTATVGGTAVAAIIGNERVGAARLVVAYLLAVAALDTRNCKWLAKVIQTRAA
jgi:hypothetical protein